MIINVVTTRMVLALYALLRMIISQMQLLVLIYA